MRLKKIIILVILLALTAGGTFSILRSKSNITTDKAPHGFERVSDTQFVYAQNTPKKNIKYLNSGFSQSSIEISLNGYSMATLTLTNASSSLLDAKLVATPDNPAQDDPPVEINPGSDTTYILDAVGVYKIINANKQDHTITVTVN